MDHHMPIQPFLLTLNSEAPDRLIAFYRDIVQLTPRFDLVPGALATSKDAPTCLIALQGAGTNADAPVSQESP
jgi:hypothetical protein